MIAFFTGMVPIYTVDKPSFRSMLHTLDPKFQCPSRSYFTREAIPTMYTTIQSQLGREMLDAHW